MASAVSGFLDAVPERRADGLLPGPRPGRRLRALGQQHGRDAPGAVQPAAGDQAPEAGHPHRRHRHPAHADHRLRRPPRALQARHRPGAGQRHPAPARGRGADPPGVHRRERRLPPRHRRREGDRLRLLRRSGRALHLRGPGAAELARRAAHVPGRLHAGARAGSDRRAGRADPGAGRDLRRPVARHGQPVVHGRQPARARHVDEQPHHRPAPAHRQDLPPGLESAEPHRPAERLRHGARGRHLEQPAAGRHGGDQPRAPRRGRAHLEAAARHDSRDARLSRRGHVPGAQARRSQGAVDPDDQSRG